MYRVRFLNPATGQGFIEGYRTAFRAKRVAAEYLAQFMRDGCKGITAEYLGKPLPYVNADPELKRKLGLR